MNYLLVLVMTMLASVASYYLKRASAGSLINVFRNRYFYYGGALYVASALVNVLLLQVMPYSVVVPLGALTYIWTMLLSARLLKEKISMRKIAGILTVIVGIFLVAL
jgi:drug/metabolite transporter (DMT)-like permease